ncbi:ACT domain-containing protein, partial [Phocaeicola paurosaccharolyticus]|uniref:ACT domain-containing protein n=1 Tax=Phocaeicola paurosaccharolyticus TaxID=732242 RepID=UPI002FE0C2B9
VEKLYSAVARKDIVLGESDKNIVLEKPSSQGWKKYITFGFRSNKSQKKEDDEEKPVAQAPDIDIKKVVHISTDDMKKNYVVADCCKPIPGDDVLGFIDDNNQIVIHKRQCPVATKLKSSFGNRLLAVEWESDQSLYFPVNLYIKGIDHIGLLNKITQVISQQLNVNIHKLTIESKDGIFEGRVQLLVHNVSDVKVLSTNLFKISEVKVVTRIENFDDKPEN